MFRVSFNSIKVRLNRKAISDMIASMRFQFHKGTIKPYDWGCAIAMMRGFQFHKGTIKPNTTIHFCHF